MQRFKIRFVVAISALCLFANVTSAAPALTTIQDVLYQADGSKFNGVLQIKWTSFQAGDTTNVPMQSITTEVNNGYLHVLLIPTTNATPPAVYTVVYNSGGSIQFTETWVVPPSTTPLRVSDVRSTSTAGSASALAQVQITDVAGLRTELNIRPTTGAAYSPSRAAVIDANGALNGASGNLSDCVHVDGSSGPCATTTGTTGGTSFSDAETPAGNIDGTNTLFQLANTPNPATSVKIVRDGLVLTAGVDFTVAGATITFLAGSVPQPGDVLQVYYRTTTTGTFADAEVPSGTIDGVNTTFTLANTPDSPMSLELYRNGLAMHSGVDYNLSGSTITFLAASVPQPGDVLQAFYRISQ